MASSLLSVNIQHTKLPPGGDSRAGSKPAFSRLPPARASGTGDSCLSLTGHLPSTCEVLGIQ